MFRLRRLNSNLSISEHSLGFREILGMKSNTTVSAIKDIMMRMQLDSGKCCGECYNGASNMIDKISAN